MSNTINEMIHVELTRDRMLGIVWFSAPSEDGKKLEPIEIDNAIKEKGIVEGIKEEIISQLKEERKYDFKYIVAQGTPSIDGVDGELTFHFDVERLNQCLPKQKEDGTVDFKDLGIVHNVKKGDVLATKTFATHGTDGVNVLGGQLRAKRGKEVRLPKGKNTEILADECTLVAGVDGKLEYDQYNIYVNTVYIVDGDVDNSTGNINFLGSVVVNGIVHSGFTIEAEGSVEIRGAVEDVTIKAGGDIILSYGIQGHDKGKLISGGNIVAKFIQNASAEAKGDIVTEAILHSDVSAGRNIRVESGKGMIVGGNVAATDLILARNIGSTMGTATCVQIGLLPSIYQEQHQLVEIIKEKKDYLERAAQSIRFLETKAKEGQLELNKKVLLSKLQAAYGPLEDELDKLNARLSVLAEKISGAHDGMIRVENDIYSGVKVTIGNTIKYIDDTHSKCSIRKIDGEVKIGM